MIWFQAAQPALQYVASGVVGFVVVPYLWNGEVKQLMGKVWDGCEDDAITLPENRGDGPEDGSSTGSDHGDGDHGDDPEDDSSTGSDHGDGDHGDDPENCSSTGSDHGDGDHRDDPEDGSSSGSEENTVSLGPAAVQLLSIRANFHIRGIKGYDWRISRVIYRPREGELQEEGMVDLVPIGPYRILEAYGALVFEVYPADDTNDVFRESCNVTMEDDEVEERTHTMDVGLGRKLEITYLVMPDATGIHVEVRLNLKDQAATCMVASRQVPLTMGAKASISSVVTERGACPFPVAPHALFTESICDCIAASSTLQTPHRGGPKSNHNL